MCILIVKPKGKANPTRETLKECFTRNPDGAGFSYNTKNGDIVIKKGFMDFDSFYKATEKIPVNSTALIHCRIGTSGGNIPELTHPYPLCSDYKSMKKTSQKLIPQNKNEKVYSVAHNGIFSGLELKENVNDTCIFIANILNPLKSISTNILDSNLDAVINRCVGTSKIAILDNYGNVKMYGSGWIEDNGIYYSNNTYKPYENVVYKNGVYYGNYYNSDRTSYCQGAWMNEIIKEWGSYQAYLDHFEEERIEKLKKDYPEREDVIEDYLDCGFTAWQIRNYLEKDDDSYLY